MVYGIKVCLYPTPSQKAQIDLNFGATRWFYNWALERSIRQWNESKTKFDFYETNSQLPKLKKLEETSWLADADSRALQTAAAQLSNAYKAFFKGAGFPNFKSAKNKQSYTLLTAKIVDGKLIHPKMEKPIKLKGLRPITGRICSITISRPSTGKYYASILVDNGAENPTKTEVTEHGIVGIDLGLTHFATLSTGEKVENTRFLKKSLKKLAKRQRQLAKSQKGSKRCRKKAVKVARCHEKVANQRKDFLHKLSTRLIRENQAVAIEDLSVASMMRHGRLSRSISDVSWSMFVGMLKYKADWYGKTVLQIGRFEPSSKLCTCGVKNSELTLADRTWTCRNCGKTHDRDVLAANNIKQFALASRISTAEHAGI